MRVGHFCARAVVALTLVASFGAPAQDSTSPGTTIPAPESLGELDAGQRPPDFPQPTHGDAGLTFTIDEANQVRLGQGIVENYLWTLERNASVFAWQDLSTKLIFTTVLLLVFVGVAFSGIQFFKGHRVKSGGEADQVSHVELSTQGVKVSSPFLGVVILTISLAFFYLYLVYVYPISLTR